MGKIALVTGCSGFIGSFLSSRLLDEGYIVIGLDNMNDYYDVKIKEERLGKLLVNDNFSFIKEDISNKLKIFEIFSFYRPDIVINLAAQAGVRYSIENPDAYIKSNTIGFYNILEACRYYPVKHLLYASSSSVYGSNTKVPFEESDFVDNPVSLYAATKKSNELFAHTYSHLYNIPATGLRFFTVYGPMGRPDMAYFKFVDMYFQGKSIHIYNNGDFNNDLYRDFTYVGDIIESITRLINKIPQSTDKNAAHTVYNIGNSQPIKLMDFIKSLEDALGNSLNKKIEFKKIYEPMKPGDVSATYANTNKLESAIEFTPQTSIYTGLKEFTDWYVKFYNIN
ncbi:GDP-mannose 4,6-dehydratase [Aerococcus urinaeequi]|uniref:GDP-mannose 4,6-dehydratase n=1 Tax=Aerococcus urinaeequi TaxID=51665 RepID=UPI003AAC0763